MNRSFSSLVLLAGLSTAAPAQSVLQYDFNNSLKEVKGVGPELKVLGKRGSFVTDTLAEIARSAKTVYRFEKNNGLQFDNKAAGSFLGESFSIELYFVFDELSSWKRVADWKNRRVDKGAYVYNGQVNFYDYVYSEKSPVKAKEYTYYVMTRDTAKNLVIYVDGVARVTHKDASGDAVIDEDGVLNLFYDDMRVQDEASSGAVAMLRLYNSALGPAAVAERWKEVANSLGLERKAGIELALAKTGRVDVYGIYFDFNSAKIKKQSEPVLKEIAGALANNPDWKLSVDGHTDNVGGDARNMELSRARAASVKQALVSRHGVAADRLVTGGHGASRPKEPNSTPKGRAKNRRVELVRQ